MKVRI